MFRKDSGAHFTYNLGVGMIRLSLAFFLWALVIVAEWFFLSSPKFVYESTVSAELTETEALGNGVYTATFLVQPRDGTPDYEHTQYATEGFIDANSGESIFGDGYKVYSLKGRGIKSGRSYGRFISRSSSLIAEWQYFFAVPGARPPVQTWGIWVSLALSVLLFMIGRRQIGLSMKYPRSDVEVGETAIVTAEDDPVDLLGEFEREYRRTHRNWAELPEKDDQHTE